MDFLHPIAAIPLKIKENVIGVISIYKLLVQKDAFTAVDYELFSLLAAHAATAIFSSKLYSQSERKLTTIQGFLDLLTTPTGQGARIEGEPWKGCDSSSSKTRPPCGSSSPSP